MPHGVPLIVSSWRRRPKSNRKLSISYMRPLRICDRQRELSIYSKTSKTSQPLKGSVITFRRNTLMCSSVTKSSSTLIEIYLRRVSYSPRKDKNIKSSPRINHQWQDQYHGPVLFFIVSNDPSLNLWLRWIPLKKFYSLKSKANIKSLLKQ